VLGRCAVEQSTAQGLVLRAQKDDLLGQVTVTLHGCSNFGASDSTDAELTVGVDGSPAVWIRCSPRVLGSRDCVHEVRFIEGPRRHTRSRWADQACRTGTQVIATRARRRVDSELMITAGNVRRERTTTSGRQPLDSVCADECDA